MNFTVVCTGKLKEKYFQEAVREYEKRLSGYCRLQIIELPEKRLSDNPSQAEVLAALARERDAVLAKIPKNALVIALCIEGKELSSQELSQQLQGWTVQGRSRFVFLIGSSYGLHPELKDRAELQLSMSPMTFPHHLARVMLLEQLYRAFKLQEGSKYHK